MIDKIIEQQEIIKGMQENEESAIKIMKMYEDLKKDYIRVKANEKILADLLDKEQKKNKKAIEYIEKNSYFEGNAVKTMIYQDYSKYILEILKGEKI